MNKKETYRDIVKKEIRKIEGLKAKSIDDTKILERYDWIISQLVDDLRDLETDGAKIWQREPYDAAFQKYQTNQSQQIDLMDIIRRMFENGDFEW